MAPELRDIPAIAQLAELGTRFVNWRWIKRGEDRTKPPYRPDGTFASSTDPATWATLDECVAARNMDGIGFVLDADRDGIVGVDLDGCRDPATGEIEPWASRIIQDVASYTEVSPSGTGVKIICLAEPVPHLRHHVLVIRPANGCKAAKIELYTSKRYFTLTGEVVEIDDEPLDEIIEATEAFEQLAYRIAAANGATGHPGDHSPGAQENVSDDIAHDPGKLPNKIAALIESDPTFAHLWRTGAKPDNGTDRTASGLDYSLMRYLAAHTNLPPAAIAGALWRFPHGQIGLGKLKGEQARRRVNNLLAEVDKIRCICKDVQEQDGSHDSLALELGQEWRHEARYVAPWSRWLFWTGSRWEIDENLIHMTRGRQFLQRAARKLIDVAQAVGDDKGLERARSTGKTLRSATTIAAVIGLARSNEELVASPQDWDRDPYLLGTPGGVIDLRTGRMIEAQREAKITKVTAVAPAAPGTPTPLWDAFLERIFRHDPALIDYIHRLLGYAATGLTVEQKLFIAFGEGENGKGVLFDTAMGVLGEYGDAAPGDLLVAGQGRRHPTELASLRAKRLVICSEIGPNVSWDEPKLKRLTGSDPISAHFMAKDPFTFVPAFTFIQLTNSLPVFRGIERALRRRMEVIPFEQIIDRAEKDPHLKEKLWAEGPGILRKIIDGAGAYFRDGLMQPRSVNSATDLYLSSFDPLSAWLEDCCSTEPGAAWTNTQTLHSYFTCWCASHRAPPISEKLFSLRLEGLGFEKTKTGRGKGFRIEVASGQEDED